MPRLALPFLAYLLVACSQGAPEPDGVRFEPSTLDLGGLRAGEARRIPLCWRRTGRGPLRVLAFEADCGCLALEGPPHAPLAPGARGTAWVRLRLPERAGPLRHRVRLYTDAAPPGDRAEVTLRGWVGSAIVLRPARLDLGARSAGAHLERDVELLLAPGVRATDLSLALRGVAGSARLLAPLRPDPPSWCVRVTLRAPAVAGPFAARVEVHAAGRRLAALPVGGTVVAGVSATRPPPARPGPDPPR